MIASHDVGKSFATDKMTETSIEGQNIKASAHMKNSVESTADVAPNTHKSKAPAATHLTIPKTPAEPALICTNEKRPSGSSLKVGMY